MARSSLPEPAQPQPVLLAQPGFEVEILPERAADEARTLGVGARVQQDAVTDNAVSQQRGRVVEEHEVDEVAGDEPAERANYPEHGVLDRPGSGRARVADEDGDVHVAVPAGGAARPASEQPREADRRLGTQAAREVVAQPAVGTTASRFGCIHGDTNLPEIGAGPRPRERPRHTQRPVRRPRRRRRVPPHPAGVRAVRERWEPPWNLPLASCRLRCQRLSRMRFHAATCSCCAASRPDASPSMVTFVMTSFCATASTTSWPETTRPNTE